MKGLFSSTRGTLTAVVVSILALPALALAAQPSATGHRSGAAAKPVKGGKYEGVLFADASKALSKRVVVGVSPQGKTGRVTYWCGTGRAPKSLSLKIRSNGSFRATSRNGTIIVWSISGRFVSDLQAVVRLGLKTDCDGKGGKLSLALSPPQQLLLAKQATAKYSSVATAEKAGYHTGLGPDGKPACVASPAGGMGIHYENAALMRDGSLDIRRPEMLVYAPQANGSLKLVALEYFKADGDQSLSTADDRPALYGHAFDGPMAEHHPGMGVHYDLHVWVWQSNPSGMFAQFNPTVSCPA